MKTTNIDLFSYKVSKESQHFSLKFINNRPSKTFRRHPRKTNTAKNNILPGDLTQRIHNFHFAPKTPSNLSTFVIITKTI